MRRRTPNRRKAQAGQSLLETTLMIVVIFSLVFWVFEVGWVMYTYSVLADAVNEGVRYAVVHSGGDPSGTQATVQNFASASFHNLSAMTLSVTFPDGSATPPNRVRVSATYTYVPWLPEFMPVAPSMQVYAEGRMVAQ